MMRKMKFMLVATAAIFTLAGQAHFTAAAVKFSDTASHWSQNGIETAVDKGYVDGYPDGTFKPDQSISRAEFITMLSKATKNIGKPGEKWYAPYVGGLLAKKVVFDGEFDDYDKFMTRLELAKLSLRMVQPDLQDPNAVVTDDNMMISAIKKGLIQGMAGGKVEPEALTTRAQSITIIERVLKVLAGETLPADKMVEQMFEVEKTGTNLETMTGRRSATPLPMKGYNVGANIYADINEIYWVDTDQLSSSPYGYLLEGGTMGYAGDKFPLDHSYVIIMKTTFYLGDGGRDSAIFPSNLLSIQGWLPVGGSQYSVPGIYKDDSGIREWYFMYASKKSEHTSMELMQPLINITRNQLPIFLPRD
jgi:hypothetical protein